MKLELPLAFGLLAIGCWLFVVPQLEREKPGIQAKIDSENQAIPAPSGESQVQVPNANSTSKVIPATHLQDRVVQTDAAELLLRAAKQLEEGSPVVSQSRLRVQMFGKTIRCSGVCYHSGRGLGKTRMEFRIPGNDRECLIRQIGNGRFFSQEMGWDPPLPDATDPGPRIQFIDLERVAAANRERNRFSSSPSDWLAMGGIPGLLRRLADDFEFEILADESLSGVPMKRLAGTWKTARLQAELEGTVDKRWLEPEINWERIPQHIPREVDIYLGNDEFLPLFPYRISFNTPGVNDEPGSQIHFEMYKVTRQSELDESLFDINVAGKNYQDLTKRFVTRLERLDEQASKTTRERSPNVSDVPKTTSFPGSQLSTQQ